MPRRGDDDDEFEDEEDDYEQEQLLDDEDEEDEEEEEVAPRGGGGGKGGGRKRSRSDFIDDAAEEDDDDDDEYDEDEGRGGRGGGGSRQKVKKRLGSEFFDEEAIVDSDDDEEEEEGEDDFIVDGGADIPDEDSGRRYNRRPFARAEDEQEDVDDLERRIQERYARSSHTSEFDEEQTEVEQQSLLPSVRDPKLWMVKCAMGREREAAVCLVQKFIDRGSELQIRSAVALDHLKNFIYVEADKEAHVREACKGLRVMFAQKIMLVPIKEMTDVLSVESKVLDLARNTWVRMKIGTYKNDLAQVVDVDNVPQRVTVKLVPRIDLQALANKLEGRDVPKKKQFVPPPRLMNIDEARELHIRVERRRDPTTGDYFENINGMLFKEGFLYKTVSLKSISVNNIKPSSNWASTPSGSYSEAGTPRDHSISSYPNAPSPYLPSTPGGQPMTPNSASYLPGTPGGQPMTPGAGALDAPTPSIGVEHVGLCFVPDILVNIHRPGEDELLGIIQEVLSDGSCKVSLGDDDDIITALPNELEIVAPRKSDKIKILGGDLQGGTGKLIGVDGSDGIVKVDGTFDVKIIDLKLLAKLG